MNIEIIDIPKVEDLYTLKSYDEISGALESWINGDAEAVESEGTEHPTSSSSDTKKDLSSSSSDYDSLDDAFSDLMD